LKYLKLKLYSKYFLSALVSASGINSILQKYGDGANESARFTNVKLSELVASLRSEAAKYKEELRELITPASTTSYSHFGIASPAYDPVTNT
jgi:hypothetical protein